MLPHGNKEDFTHCDMEILISEDVVEVMVEVEEEEEGWLSEDVTERDTGGGQGTFHFCGNGRNGQYRNGFASTQDEGRRDIRLEMPPEPEPSRFLDWSSLASLPARTSPHGTPDVQAEQSNNAQNQLNVSNTGETRQERIEVHAAEGVVIAPTTDQLREN